MLRTRIAGLAAVAVAGFTLAACSSGSLSGDDGSDGGDGGGSSQELTEITVGMLQIAPSAAVQLGMDEGIFEEHGLDVTIQFGKGGAALLPAVSSGSIEFAVGNPLSVLIAASQGLNMKIIAGYSSIDAPEPPAGLVVQAGSGIEDWTDLEGKTVAVNTVNTQGHLTTLAQVEAAGGDPSAVEFKEIAFPDQLAQLEQGHIDAAWVPEPFLNAARNTEGVEYFGSPMTIIPGLYSMVTFAAGDYVDANPEVVEAFVAALGESTDLAMEDQDAYREAIVEFTGMDAEVVEAIALEDLSAELDPSIIEDLSEMALKYGFMETAPDLDSVILK